ncbi:MAG: ADP-ribosylation factor-like protein [Promethearchaeota archaeon]
MQEFGLALSYFDQIIGPNIFYSNLEFGEDAPNLEKILEFNDKAGTFIFAFRKYQTVNHIFFIDSKAARGGKELVMVSFLIKTAYFKNEIVDVFKYLESLGPILEEYASKIKELEELADILHTSKKRAYRNVLDLGSNNFKAKFFSLHEEYLKKLSPIHDILAEVNSRSELKKIFIFGPLNAGKNTLLKNMETIQFHNQNNNDLPTRIYELVIDNLDILTHDCIEKEFTCDKCRNFGGCTENAQGFIFIFDVSDKNSLPPAIIRFNKLMARCKELESRPIPTLIIGNKKHDLELISPDIVEKEFDFAYLKECGIKTKYFSIDVLKDHNGVMESLKWLIKKML